MTTWMVRSVAPGDRADDPAEVNVPVDVDVAVDAAGRQSGTRVILGETRPATRRRGAIVELVVEGWRFELEVEQASRARLRAGATVEVGPDRTDAGHELRAIIPGRVVSVAVAAGDRVVAGQPLLVVEAMKMQNELRSPRDGVVDRLAVGPDETIELGDLLVVIAATTDGS